MSTRIRMLVVGDDIEFIGGLADELTDSNIDLVAADSPETLYERFGTSDPDVIVLDIGLGVRMINHIIRLLKIAPGTLHVPILLFTNKYESALNVPLGDADISFTKPFLMEDFIRFIEKSTGKVTKLTSCMYPAVL